MHAYIAGQSSSTEADTDGSQCCPCLQKGKRGICCHKGKAHSWGMRHVVHSSKNQGLGFSALLDSVATWVLILMIKKSTITFPMLPMIPAEASSHSFRIPCSVISMSKCACQIPSSSENTNSLSIYILLKNKFICLNRNMTVIEAIQIDERTILQKSAFLKKQFSNISRFQPD